MHKNFITEIHADNLSNGRFLKRILRSPSFTLGLVIIGIFLVVAILSFLGFLPFPPNEQHPQSENLLQPPGLIYLMGSDQFGRDIFSRLMWSTISTLWIAISSVAIALFIGGFIGIVSGYIGHWLDMILMRVVEVLLAFPTLLLALMIVSALGVGSNNAIPAISIIHIPIFARFLRALVLSGNQSEYVVAARSFGATNTQIIRRHILPQLLPFILIIVSLSLSRAILIQATLSYLGLGTQPPEASWGMMLREGRRFIQISPWLSVFPGLTIMLAIFAFNLMADGLRDYFDPKNYNL